MEIIGIDRLRSLYDRSKILGIVREALIQHSKGLVQSPKPGQLMFQRPHGDCHIKFGHVNGGQTFAIKVATGFYNNGALGLPVNHGLILVMDAETGEPKVILKDDGWLTAWRTAAATALAANVLKPKNITGIGIFGTGLQARLTAEWVSDLVGSYSITVCGRSLERTKNFVASLEGLNASATDQPRKILSSCNLIITATPSEKPLFAAEWVLPGTHIIGIGADSPGKQEIPCGVFEKAKHILTDDMDQSIDHGDIGNAIRSGITPRFEPIVLGDLLNGFLKCERDEEDITVADLTGIAAEDIAMANYFSAA